MIKKILKHKQVKFIFERIMKKYRNIFVICQRYSIFRKSSSYFHIDFMITKLNFWTIITHCFEIECIRYSNSNFENSKNMWRKIYRKKLSYLVKRHTFRSYYLQLNSTINYVYAWIIVDSITLRNVIDISFFSSKIFWSKYKIANIWSNWISYRLSTNFE